MVARTVRIRIRDADDEVAVALRGVRARHGLETEFPAGVLAEAASAVEAWAASVSPPASRPGYADRTDLPLVTIDPPGSTDLDQAVLIERTDAGFRVFYAIADVAAFVRPAGAVDDEARRRGQSVYLPDGRVSLHPTAIGDDGASLLEGVVRPAFLWSHELDSDGVTSSVALDRALVRSTARLDYEGVQASIDAGAAHDSIALLPEVGALLVERERARGGASLSLPNEEIVRDDGRYRLERRASLPVEDWNAQISLLTGMAAARLMLDARVGILRTMPPPEARAVETLRQQARALGRPWPEELPYGEFLRSLDTTDARQLAIMYAAAALFRGAGYTAFDGETPPEPAQAAIAAPYGHTTAPIRRLVDRFVLVLCHALASGAEPPAWVREALPGLPTIMAASDRVAASAEREAQAIVEAAVLSAHVGDELDGVVVTTRRTRVSVQLVEPQLTVDVPVEGEAPEPGTRVRVRVDAVDIAEGRSTLTLR